jgi:hypothetical protein
MAERIRSIMEGGKEILVIDMTNCRPSEVADLARNVPNLVSEHPRGSVLLLVNFTGASFDPEAIRTIKESAVFGKPFIKRSAWIGAEDSLKSKMGEIQDFSRRALPIFSTVQQAISFLVKD